MRVCTSKALNKLPGNESGTCGPDDLPAYQRDQGQCPKHQLATSRNSITLVFAIMYADLAPATQLARLRHRFHLVCVCLQSVRDAPTCSFLFFLVCQDRIPLHFVTYMCVNNGSRATCVVDSAQRERRLCAVLQALISFVKQLPVLGQVQLYLLQPDGATGSLSLISLTTCSTSWSRFRT